VTDVDAKPVTARPSAHVSRKRAMARDRIVDAAIREFATRGYERTTMSDVAAALNMTSAALYYYFSAKDELLFAALDTVLSTLLARLVDAGAAQRLDPAARLKAIVVAQVTYELEVSEAAPLVNAHLYGPRYLVDALDPDKRRILRKRQRAIVDVYSEAIEAGQRSGTFQMGDCDALALDILALAQYPAVWYRPGKGLSVSEIAERQAASALKLMQQ
jgi:AcrR family transcriptional regulator